VFDEVGSSTCSAGSTCARSATPGEPIGGQALGDRKWAGAGLPDRHAGIASRAKAASIYTDHRFSDHAPVTIDYWLP